MLLVTKIIVEKFGIESPLELLRRYRKKIWRDRKGQIAMRHILHQQYDAVGSHTVQETKHNPNPNRL